MDMNVAYADYIRLIWRWGIRGVCYTGGGGAYIYIYIHTYICIYEDILWGVNRAFMGFVGNKGIYHTGMMQGLYS